MKKLTARILVGIVLVAVAAFLLGAVFAQARENDDVLAGATDQGEGNTGGQHDNPIARVLGRLAHNGVITQGQAEAVASHVLPVVHEMIVEVKHRHAHERLERTHERIHEELKVPGKPKNQLEAAQHRLLLELFGLGPKELRDKLAHMESIASVGESLGIATADIVTTLLGPIEDHLAMAVQKGKLTEQEAAERLVKARNEILEHVESGG